MTIEEVIASFRQHAANIHPPGERDPHEDDIESVEDMEHDTWLVAAEDLEKALADLTPKIEILHVRDPDNACYVMTWVNGAITTLAHVEDIDAGRGWTREDWDARVHEIEHESPGYSEDYRGAILDAMADPPGSGHIR